MWICNSCWMCRYFSFYIYSKFDVASCSNEFHIWLSLCSLFTMIDNKLNARYGKCLTYVNDSSSVILIVIWCHIWGLHYTTLECIGCIKINCILSGPWRHPLLVFKLGGKWCCHTLLCILFLIQWSLQSYYSLIFSMNALSPEYSF